MHFEELLFVPVTPNELCEPRYILLYRIIKEKGVKSINIHPVATRFENTPNPKLFAFDLIVLGGKWESVL